MVQLVIHLQLSMCTTKWRGDRESQLNMLCSNHVGGKVMMGKSPMFMRVHNFLLDAVLNEFSKWELLLQNCFSFDKWNFEYFIT